MSTFFLLGLVDIISINTSSGGEHRSDRARSRAADYCK